MATTWADIVSAAMVQIDDVRLQEQIAVNPAQFYRRMAGFVTQAMALLSKPPELLKYLQSGMIAPRWADDEWTSTEASLTGETVLDTGYTGYMLCSVSLITYDGVGVPSYSAYNDAVYDEETGTVTFPQQASAGLEYVIDFYTDGEFPDLSETQMRLFALAVASVWDERFSRTWLNLNPKIKDASFETVNEANYTEKITNRLHANKKALNDELRAYEQLCAYTASVHNGANRVSLV